MKILQINTRYIGGGGAAYIANILHSNINSIDGYSSKFLFGRGIDGDNKSYRITFPKMDYLSALSYRLFSKEINFNKNIENYIIECDIVHLHNIHGYFIDYKILFELLKKHNKKIVWTLHDMWPITGRCAYSFGCDKWKDSCGKCGNKESYPISFVDRSSKDLKLKKEIIGSVDEDKMTIITPSKWLANICKESYLNKFKITNIPNGIEHDEVKISKVELRERYNIVKDKKAILFVAADTSDERKGIKYILDIIPQCKDYIFISIGRAIENVKFDNFIQLGYISSRESINEIYSMSDIFVIPSLDDNFPTTVIEAFANYTPVIGFDIGGIQEQLSGNVGTVISNISSNDLKDGILELLKDKNKLVSYSNNSRKKFLNEYTKAKFINGYLDIYNNMFDKSLD